MRHFVALINVISVMLAGCSLENMMFHGRQSPYDFDKTVALIETNAKAEGWVVPKGYDFQASMKKYKQSDPGKVYVLSMNMGLISKVTPFS